MSRFTIAVFAVFCIMLAAYAAYRLWPRAAVQAADLTNYPSKGADIIAFGDSLVAGYGSNDNGGFVSILSKDLGEPIVNLGVDGDTTSQALARVSGLDAYHPKAVIVLVGGNDYLHKKDMAKAFANLGSIITDMQKRGAVVVLVGVRVNYYVGNFDRQYEQLVAKYKVAYVPDALDGVIGNPKYMYDSIHPNDAGYQILASRIEPALQSVLK